MLIMETPGFRHHCSIAALMHTARDAMEFVAELNQPQFETSRLHQNATARLRFPAAGRSSICIKGWSVGAMSGGFARCAPHVPERPGNG